MIDKEKRPAGNRALDENEESQGNPSDRQVPAWLAERMAAHRERKQQRRADRAAFAETRGHGLRARHANKLRHLRGERR